MTIEGDPWFVAVDVLKGLTLDKSKGSGMYLKPLDATEKLKATRNSYHNLFVGGTSAPSYTLISESGLYKLLMRSDKPEAKPFQDWITKEVIPTIRKTGQYDLKKDSGRDALVLPESFAEALRGHAEALGMLMNVHSEIINMIEKSEWV